MLALEEIKSNTFLLLMRVDESLIDSGIKANLSQKKKIF